MSTSENPSVMGNQQEILQRPEKVSYAKPRIRQAESRANTMDPECFPYDSQLKYAEAIRVSTRGIRSDIMESMEPSEEEAGTVEDLSDLERDPRYADLVT